MRPIIGVTVWKRNLGTLLGSESLQTLSISYTNALIDSGMTPVMFPAAQDPSEADRLVSLVDGVLISGGDDLDPASYGVEVKGSKDYSKAVDDFEIAVIKTARNQGKPVLAICRGLQALNVALGGTIDQEVLESGTIHELINQESDPDELSARRHVVHLEPDSILAGLYGSAEAKVNSLHHQGVGELAADLVVEGRTADGLIEAARCDGTWWALGVQWHPERMDGDHHELFNSFREAVAGS